MVKEDLWKAIDEVSIQLHTALTSDGWIIDSNMAKHYDTMFLNGVKERDLDDVRPCLGWFEALCYSRLKENPSLPTTPLVYIKTLTVLSDQLFEAYTRSKSIDDLACLVELGKAQVEVHNELNAAIQNISKTLIKDMLSEKREKKWWKIW